MSRLLFAALGLFLGLPAHALAAELYQAAPPGTHTRWISPENPTGAKGAGGRTNRGAKGRAFIVVAPGETAVLADLQGAGILHRMWLSGTIPRNEEQRRLVRLEMFWDGAARPAVAAPIGDFFGVGLGLLVPFESAWFASPEGRSYNVTLPMPFRTGARVQLVNESQAHLLVWYDINYTEVTQHAGDVLYFHASWRRERRTALGRDFEILPRVTGRGRYLGANIGVIGGPDYRGTWFGEGEVKVYLDGDTTHPTLVGTGTEDYIGSGWGQGRYQGRLYGSLVSDDRRDLYAFYRFHLDDPVYFHQDCRVTLQQMGNTSTERVREMLAQGVELQPVWVLDVHGGDVLNLTGRAPAVHLLLDRSDLPPFSDPQHPAGGCNFYRRDDVSATAYFYLDRPENDLPALASAEARVEGLRERVWTGAKAARPAPPAPPDFGPRVLVFGPGQPGMQEQVEAVFREQERAQFGTGRYALLFKPGRYALDVKVGFYTHVAGLGRLPGDVTFQGRVWTDAAWMRQNATCNFWRAVENLTLEPPGGVNVWAVSQAAPMRRTHVRGDLHLSSGGWSSGGFLADCRVDGTVETGSQQQWFSRNSAWGQWKGANWNMVFVGCENSPAGEWPARAVTRVDQTPAVREKPFLTVEDGRWAVRVPPLRRTPSAGLSWPPADAPDRVVPLDRFHLAKAGLDTAASINAALRAGRHLLLTPGLYPLDDTLVVTHSNTIVLGLGFPTLIPSTGRPALRVEAAEGAIVSGVVVDAGAVSSDTLVEFGVAGRRSGRAENPTCVHDLVCRVGGYGPGRARRMVVIHHDHLIGDNFWLWRADHGANVGWTENPCENGLVVNGNDVTIYGLFVEHTQGYQTIWNGERGRVYFYQSEMPYDPPSQEAWRSPSGDGFASYKVGEHVEEHEAWGLGVYHVFTKAAVVAERAFEAPAHSGVRLRHLVTFRLGGGRPGSGIRHVLNGEGADTIQGQKATLP